MKVKDVIKKLGLKLVAGEKGIDKEIKDAYCGDLLSNVMGNASRGSLWITIQTHPNIVAVAVLKEMVGIIISNNYMVEQETKTKADEEDIPILITDMTSFQIAGKLYELGIGKDEDI